MICKAAEIILTLSATFKGSADQQRRVKTDFTFLEHDNLFSQIYSAWRTDSGNRTRSVDLSHSLSV